MLEVPQTYVDSIFASRGDFHRVFECFCHNILLIHVGFN